MSKIEPPAESKHSSPPGLKGGDYFLLWFCLVAWIVTFLGGTLIDSGPFRESLTSFKGHPADLFRDALVVLGTFTFTNVAILCLFAGVLGTLARRSQLGTDDLRFEDRDSVNPRSSSVLRAFLVYLLLIAGVLILGDDPAQPTQKGYVRLAGLISLLSFVVNARPRMFGRMLRRAGDAFDADAAT